MIGFLFAASLFMGGLATDTTEVRLDSPVASLSIAAVEPLTHPEIRMLFRADDADGHPVWGLNSSDVEISESSEPCDIVSFWPLNQPKRTRLAIPIDCSGSMSYDSLQLASLGFFEDSTRFQDGYVIGDLPEAYVEPLTYAKSAVLDFLSAFEDTVAVIPFSNMGADLSTLIQDRDTLRMIIEGLQPNGGTAFYDAIEIGIHSLMRDSTARSGEVWAIVALTDGVDNASALSFDSCLALATDARIPVYTIGLGGADRLVLETIADVTGGRSYFTTDPSQLTTIYQEIQNDLKSYYEVVYRSRTLESMGEELPEVMLSIPQFDVEAHYPISDNMPEVVRESLESYGNAEIWWLLGGLLGAMATAGGLYFYWRKRKNATLEITRLYPNPTRGPIAVDFTGTPNRWWVKSMDGSTIQNGSMDAGKNPLSLDLSGLQPGVYLFALSNEQGEQVMERVVVEQ